MEQAYFNFRATLAGGRSQQRRFLARWWQFYAADRHWTPPFFPALLAALDSQHVRRSRPLFLSLEALSSQAASSQPMSVPVQPLLGMVLERPVAAAAALHDPRQRAALLALLHSANDRMTLRHLLERTAAESDAQSFLGPVALSPYLGAGALASHWSETPPLDTPYGPPYLAELLGSMMELVEETHLYTLPVAALKAGRAPATLQPLDPVRLASDLLPLFAAIYGDETLFAPPDAAEARFLLDWWSALAPPTGWLAAVDGHPAGFVLLQPDMAPWLRRAAGGRRLWRSWSLQWTARPASQGRVLLGGVAPPYRRQGLGRQLLEASLESAAMAGWQRLLVGPVSGKSGAAALLASAGAQPRQSYQLFRWQAASEGWW